VRPEALDALRLDRENALARQFPLLEAAAGDESGGAALAGQAGEVATLDEAAGGNED
jgi:hypothetical protein